MKCCIHMQLSLPSILCVTYAFYAKMKRKTSKTSKTSEDKLMFSMMSRRIDRDFERYSKGGEKRSEVGKKGGAPKGNANAARNPKQAKTKVYPMSRTN